MNITVIPWHVFLEAVREQRPGTLETWLRRWLFTNEGVIMAQNRKHLFDGAEGPLRPSHIGAK